MGVSSFGVQVVEGIIPVKQEKKEHKTTLAKCFKEIKDTVLRIKLQTSYIS